MTETQTQARNEPATEWSEARASLRIGNVLERLGVGRPPPLSVFEVRAAVGRDARWNPDSGDPLGDGWAAAYDRRGLLNLIAVLERDRDAALREQTRLTVDESRDRLLNHDVVDVVDHERVIEVLAAFPHDSTPGEEGDPDAT